jgi:hypothetical protein
MRTCTSALAGLGALLVASLFGACSSGAEDTAPPKFSSVVAERDVVDGQAQLTSTLKVTFDRDWELADTNLPFASLFELSVPKADGSTGRVLIRTADRSATNTRLVTLTVAALVPEDSTLSLQRRAFDRKATGTIETKVQSELDASLVLLASEALVVTRQSFFADPTVAPLKEADRDTATMRTALQAHLAARQENTETTAKTLDLYDSMSQTVVPSPKLRAGLAALTGTFAEPAIRSLLTSDNCTGKPAVVVAFQVPPGNPDLLAQVSFSRAGRTVSVNPFAEGERLEHLMPILAHEAIHCDDEDGIFEEVAATAFDGFLYLQLVSLFPDLAEANTRVARELNIDAVAMVNSGRRYPESIGILQSAGVQLALPMTNSEARSFADIVALAYQQLGPNSPTETVAQQYVQIIAGASGQEAGDPFDLRYLDELLSQAVDGGVLAGAITAFQLTPMS